ncbi:hypothetical protein [Actinoplanes aureus]|nr:hypothetical protein [Actinoplanes aureus]
MNSNKEQYESPSFIKMGKFRKLTGVSVFAIDGEWWLGRYV